MRKILLITASALTLSIAISPLTSSAAEQTTTVTTHEEHVVDDVHSLPQALQRTLSNGWKATKGTASRVVHSASSVTKSGYDHTLGAFVKTTVTQRTVIEPIDIRVTTAGMINKDVYNENGQQIGKIYDIILDRSGRAKMAVISLGESMGMGEKVAFNYNMITKRSYGGDVITPLTRAIIDQATGFSYDTADQPKPNVYIINGNDYSVNDLLAGQLRDDRDREVAEIDNIVFFNGQAKDIVISHGKNNYMEAIPFNELDIIPHGQGYDVKFMTTQAAMMD
jgi:hypothetical protein